MDVFTIYAGRASLGKQKQNKQGRKKKEEERKRKRQKNYKHSAGYIGKMHSNRATARICISLACLAPEEQQGAGTGFRVTHALVCPSVLPLFNSECKHEGDTEYLKEETRLMCKLGSEGSVMTPVDHIELDRPPGSCPDSLCKHPHSKMFAGRTVSRIL